MRGELLDEGISHPYGVIRVGDTGILLHLTISLILVTPSFPSLTSAEPGAYFTAIHCEPQHASQVDWIALVALVAATVGLIEVDSDDSVTLFLFVVSNLFMPISNLPAGGSAISK